MASSRFRSDKGLTVRMSTVMLLLGALYVAVMAGLIIAGVGTLAVIVIAGGSSAWASGTSPTRSPWPPCRPAR